MKTSYEVIIRKEHCIGRSFTNIYDCPLCAAIREQLPEFPLEVVGTTSIRTKEGQYWEFNGSLKETGNWGWTGARKDALEKGEILEYVVKFTLRQSSLHTEEKVEKPVVKEKIRYVGVPITITEETKQLILN